MTRIKYILLLLVGLCCFGNLSAQSTSDLESRLKKATTYLDKMLIKYDLAKAYMKSDLPKAARHAQDAADIAYKMRDKDWQAKIYYLDGEIHLKRRDESRAEARFKSALSNAKSSKNNGIILGSTDQLAKLAYKDRNYKKAYEYVKESLKYAQKAGTAPAPSPTTSNSSSSTNSKEIIRLENANVKLANEKNQVEREIIRLKEQIAEIKGESVDFSSAKDALDKKDAEINAERQRAEEAIRSKEEELAQVSEAKDKVDKRFKKLSEEEKVQEMQLLQQKKELLEVQVQTEQQNKNFALAGLGAAFLILLILLRLWANRRAKKKLEAQNKLIQEERKRSDELLLNILPEQIAKELKENGKAKAQKYDSVSVLFTDFKNFSGIAERLSPEALVAELDHCFKAFDYIISQYPDIEKIKTIGDAYMCASGLTDRKKLPTDIVKAGLEMQEFLTDYKEDRTKVGLPFFEARIGVHTGPVVAGVVGFNKFAYDIWGDTVNTASRMESNCEPGKVNISESTFNQVRYKFDCNYRGKIAAKNKGMIDMYYVEKAL